MASAVPLIGKEDISFRIPPEKTLWGCREHLMSTQIDVGRKRSRALLTETEKQFFYSPARKQLPRKAPCDVGLVNVSGSDDQSPFQFRSYARVPEGSNAPPIAGGISHPLGPCIVPLRPSNARPRTRSASTILRLPTTSENEAVHHSSPKQRELGRVLRLVRGRL